MGDERIVLRVIEQTLTEQFGAQVLLPFDVRDRVVVEQAIGSLPHDWKRLMYL